MRKTYIVERRKKRYNEAMRKRLQGNHSAGKAPKSYKTPQVRYPMVNKVKLERKQKYTN